MKVNKWLLGLFSAAECLIFLVFLALDLTGRSAETVPLKYAGILLCVLYALLCALRGGDRLVLPALALTAGADWFLLVQNRHLTLGILLFLGVQTLYFIRLRRAGVPAALPLRLLLPLLFGLGVWAAGLLSPLDLLAALYFSQLAANTALSWTAAGRKLRLFAPGLTLFVCCDLCVGLFNLYGLVPDPLYRFSAVGMWLFYLPSQVLIALSALPRKEVVP